MQESVDSLESQLAEKEQLVAALTERLEQAAEQLDRLHRTGADRALRAGFMGIPPEMVQQQKKLVEDLERAVQQWEDMQPGAFFGRIETQLSQIQECIRNSDHPPSSHAPSDRAFAPSGYSSTYADFVRNNGGSTGGGESRSGSSAAPNSLLDLTKNGGGGPHSTSTEAESDDPESNSSDPAPRATPVDIILPPLQDPPEPIDRATATAEELAGACEIRDSYIVYLLQRLRQIESRGHVPNSWADVADVPDEMRVRLEALEKRLEETLRLAEVELSLQRAKLGREEARIRTLDDQVQKELRRARDGSEGHEDGRGEELTGGRWRRMLGRRNNEST
jgi:hypothetical protein